MPDLTAISDEEYDRLQTEFGIDFDEFALKHPLAPVETSGRPFVRDWLQARRLLERVNVERFAAQVLREAKERHRYFQARAEDLRQLEVGGWVQSLNGVTDWTRLLAVSLDRRREHLARLAERISTRRTQEPNAS
jgi:hypothetical protein